MKKIFFIAGLAICMASCKTVKSGTTKTMDILGPGVIQMPLVAELNVKPSKVSMTKVFSKKAGSSVDARTSLVRELLERENADVLVEPTFESSTTAAKITITVYGFPATYVNFRSIEDKDVKLLEVSPKLIQKADNQSSTIQVSGK